MRMTKRGFLKSALRICFVTALLLFGLWVWALFYFAGNPQWLPIVFGTGAGFESDLLMRLLPLPRVNKFDDVRWRDMSWLDLSKDKELPYTLYFNSKTIWPKARCLPPGFDPDQMLSAAMNPGLGVRELHRQGITGKGVSVAIIDQPMYQDHPEFAGKIAAYFGDSGSSMHGPAVASLLVGTNCGTAPEARLYYGAAPSWLADAAHEAIVLDRIVKLSATLPAADKIRVVSVSSAPGSFGGYYKQNQQMWLDARARAEKAGILVLDGQGFDAPCWYDAGDRENPAKCMPGYPGMEFKTQEGKLHVPCSQRSMAEELVAGQHSYQYTGRGGQSWACPYVAGVLALGWQVRPDLSADEMKDLLFRSACVKEDGSKVINPGEFIRLVKEAKRPADTTQQAHGE